MDPRGAPLQAATPPPGGTPPGGAPPGGGYGPPPGGHGGPPPGGGYGPPPGGGYGPPPGGGYGPPPGGHGGPPPGGFGGAPPPGGFGPPGYGPPPGGYGGPPPGGFGAPPPGVSPYGYGGPPMRRPPPKTNLGLILGIGCGALLLLSILAGAVVIYLTRKVNHELNSMSIPLEPSGAPQPEDSVHPLPHGSGSLSAEVRDLRGFKASIGKLHYVVGEIHNTGSAPIGSPSAKVTLYNAANVAVESGACTSPVRVLPPGEKVPCLFTATKATTFSSVQAEVAPMPSKFKGQLAMLRIADTKFTPKRGASPYQVDGKITNDSAFTAKSVWALVSLYDGHGKIVGTTQALVAGNDLLPGASGLFTARIVDVASAPTTWQVLAVGYSE